MILTLDSFQLCASVVGGELPGDASLRVVTAFGPSG